MNVTYRRTSWWILACRIIGEIRGAATREDAGNDRPVASVKSRSALVRRIAAAALLAVGCVPSLNVSGYPLYPDPTHPRPRREIARVFGPIASVDGHDVSHLGSAFEVLPGCHVVWTRSEGVESTNYVAMVGRAGARSFVLAMKPGYTYIVKQRVLEEMGSRFRLVVFAEERDPTGGLGQVVYPAIAYDDTGLQARNPGGIPGAGGVVSAQSRAQSASDESPSGAPVDLQIERRLSACWAMPAEPRESVREAARR